MRAAIRWAIRELVRPRGPVRHRFYRASRSSRSGIALLMVMASMTLMIVLVTEMTFQATVRMQLGAHQRDEVKAEALAMTGYNLYRLVLTGSKSLGDSLAKFIDPSMLAMLGISGDSLWQMVPYINTGMMRMLLVSGGSPDEGDSPTTLTDEQVAESREDGGDDNFLDFDGDFYAEVSDEDRKINVSRFTATTAGDMANDATVNQLVGLMSGVIECPVALGAFGGPPPGGTAPTRDDVDQFFLDKNLDRMDLIGNLIDWGDADNLRIYRGGLEDNLYNVIEPEPYLPKNAPLDTFEEIRLIDGWNDDDVWERFGKQLTVYGSGKVNVTTAECGVMHALLASGLEPMPTSAEITRIQDAIQQQAMITPISSVSQLQDLIKGLGYTTKSTFSAMSSSESLVFRVTSTGQVGDAAVTVEAVIDYSGSGTQGLIGQVLYFRVK
jgi:type II secretory pathway component PulK